MILYAKNGFVNLRFDFQNATLLTTTSPKVKAMENEVGQLRLSENGLLSFATKESLVTTPVVNASRRGRYLSVKSAHSNWLFELALKAAN